MYTCKKGVAVLVALLLCMQVLAVGTYASGEDVFNKISGLDSVMQARIIGVFWEYVSAYGTGGNSPNTDDLVHDIWQEFVTIGLDDTLEQNGVTKDNIKTTILKFKANADNIKSLVTLSEITSTENLQAVLTLLDSIGNDYIDGDISTLIGNNIAQMLVIARAINSPIFTNGQNGSVTINGSNITTITNLVRNNIPSFPAGDYTALAQKAASEMSKLSQNERDAVIYVLESFNLYAKTPTPTPTPTPTSGGGGGGGGRGATNTPAPNTPVPTPTPITVPTPTPVSTVTDKPVVQETEKVTSTVSGTSAKAVINETIEKELLTKIDTIVNTADEYKGDGKVETVLNIKVETTSVVSSVDVELPSSIFAAAEDKGIDKLSIETSIATIAIPSDALSVTGSEKVSLSASVVDKSLLPEDVQAAVGNETVYDFNAVVGNSKVSEFKKKLEISIPYTLKPDENPKKVTVFYINDKGQLENVVGKYDEKTGKISFTTKHFSGYVAKVNNITFDDVTAGNWAKENIEVMAAKGVIAGVGDGLFLPDDSVTRAEFAAMIVRTFKLQDATATSKFSDISESDWFYGEVSAAVKAGIITGRPDGTFAPNENITRQDMAVIVARVLKSIKNKTLSANANTFIDKFGDNATVASYAKDSVSMAVKYGIINGMAGNFVPKENTTRAQTAAVIYRVFYLE